jgi:hypothetical protein
MTAYGRNSREAVTFASFWGELKKPVHPLSRPGTVPNPDCARMSAPVTTTPPPDRLRLILAFAAVYIIWGSTYLAVALVTERLPPLFTSAVRFLLAGSLMYGYARAKGIAPPTFRNWGAALLVGTLLLGVGNGTLAIAIQNIPTGVVALLIASLPLWIVLLNWVAFARKRPGPRETAGVVLGLLGMTILIGPDRLQTGGGLHWADVALLLSGTISWAIGTLAARRTPLPPPRPWPRPCKSWRPGWCWCQPACCSKTGRYWRGTTGRLRKSVRWLTWSFSVPSWRLRATRGWCRWPRRAWSLPTPT